MSGPIQPRRTALQAQPPALAPGRSPSRLRLLEVGPRTLHAYWRLALPALRRALSRAGRGGRVLLRLAEANGAPGFPLDLEVPVLGGHYYVDFWRDGHVLTAALGVADRWGSFQPLACAPQLPLGRANPGPHGPLLFGLANPGGGVRVTRVCFPCTSPAAPPCVGERTAPSASRTDALVPADATAPRARESALAYDSSAESSPAPASKPPTHWAGPRPWPPAAGSASTVWLSPGSPAQAAPPGVGQEALSSPVRAAGPGKPAPRVSETSPFSGSG